MAISLDGFWTPGWTTAKPGDMKYTSGLRTEFEPPAKSVTRDVLVDWAKAVSGKEDPEESSTEFFKREWLTHFKNENEELLKMTEPTPAPTLAASRDVPEQITDAW